MCLKVSRRNCVWLIPALLVGVTCGRLHGADLPSVPKTIEQLKKIQAQVKTVTAKLRKATVGVRVRQAQGSGVIVNDGGYVLTAAHVAGGAGRRVTLVLPDGSTVPGRSLGLNRSMDAALIKILGEEDKKWPFMPMAKLAAKAGDWCIAMGHPGGFRRDRPAVLRLGKVISLQQNAVVTDCTLVGGDSGGPLANLKGEIIGIHSRIGSSLTANMHVPVLAYRKDWTRLVKGDTWGHLPGHTPYIGVKGDADEKGALIEEVIENSPAAKAGLKKGDVVLRFAGKKVADFETLYNLVQETAPGDKVKLTVDRAKKRLEILLTIGRRR